jgi:hypothetical protein
MLVRLPTTIAGPTLVVGPGETIAASTDRHCRTVPSLTARDNNCCNHLSDYFFFRPAGKGLGRSFFAGSLKLHLAIQALAALHCSCSTMHDAATLQRTSINRRQALAADLRAGSKARLHRAAMYRHRTQLGGSSADQGACSLACFQGECMMEARCGQLRALPGSEEAQHERPDARERRPEDRAAGAESCRAWPKRKQQIVKLGQGIQLQRGADLHQSILDLREQIQALQQDRRPPEQVADQRTTLSYQQAVEWVRMCNTITWSLGSIDVVAAILALNGAMQQSSMVWRSVIGVLVVFLVVAWALIGPICNPLRLPESI